MSCAEVVRLLDPGFSIRLDDLRVNSFVKKRCVIAEAHKFAVSRVEHAEVTLVCVDIFVQEGDHFFQLFGRKTQEELFEGRLEPLEDVIGHITDTSPDCEVWTIDEAGFDVVFRCPVVASVNHLILSTLDEHRGDVFCIDVLVEGFSVFLGFFLVFSLDMQEIFLD